MKVSRAFLISMAAALVAGIVSTGVTWHPSPRTTVTGFPFPIGIEVVLEDGSTDCGAGRLGFFLNPLVFLIAMALCWMVLSIVGRFRARRTRDGIDPNSNRSE